MQVPRVDFKTETARLDFFVRQMRIEAHNDRKRVETIGHIRKLLAGLQNGKVSATLAMRWLDRIEQAYKKSQIT